MANLKLRSKLFPKKRDQNEVIDTVHNGDLERNTAVLMEAFYAWTGLDKFRKMALRNEKYTFGDQWHEKIETECGLETEREYIKRKGNIPMQNNRIRGIVRSVVGVFSNTQTEPVCVARDRDEQGMGETMSVALQYCYQLNRLWELDRRVLEGFLISGVGVFKSVYSWRKNKMDVWNDAVNINHFFFDNDMQDVRHWDCHLVGQIYDLGIYDVMELFAKNDPKRASQIREIYREKDVNAMRNYVNGLTEDKIQHVNFFMPENPSRCRVIEVWRQESKERLRVLDHLTGEYYKAEVSEEDSLLLENVSRLEEQLSMGVLEEDTKLLEYEWFVDNYWYYRYLSPTGEVLDQGESPYWHEEHPYSFKIYPFYNGRVYPFVGDFIDQQRILNRYIITQDFIMRHSAKGVLMFPESAKPDDMSMRDIADAWTTIGGIVYYKAKAGVQAPHAISGQATQAGIFEMIQLQLRLFEDISGVQGALQGQTPTSGTPASLYMQQTQNSTTSLTDIFDSFKELREERDRKNMQLIQQYYNEPRYLNIVGNDTKNVYYTPEKVRNAEYDLAITESTSAPTYRMANNQLLIQLFQQGAIQLKELLSVGNFPFSDKLLQSVQEREKELANNQPMGNIDIPVELQEQMMQKRQ